MILIQTRSKGQVSGIHKSTCEEACARLVRVTLHPTAEGESKLCHRDSEVGRCIIMHESGYDRRLGTILYSLGVDPVDYQLGVLLVGNQISQSIPRI